MKRELTIRHRLDSVRMLNDAVNAMKSLSAHHLRASRAGIAPARAYRDGIDALLASTGITQAAPATQTSAVLLIAADLGLCDGYTQRLVDAAVAERRTGPGPFYCVGRRSLRALKRDGIQDIARDYEMPTSADGVTHILLTVADDVLGGYLRGEYGRLLVVSARFDGVGAFTPTVTRVLPVSPRRAVGRRAAVPYVGRSHLTRTAVREYLYSTLYELLLDALASEHGTRLVATQAASQWLEQRRGELQRQLAAVRQEANTQEVLDVASGARHRRRAHAG